MRSDKEKLHLALLQADINHLTKRIREAEAQRAKLTEKIGTLVKEREQLAAELEQVKDKKQ